ncbi:MAG: IgGFc-binding protein [Paludibacteraceae bacterium]|nr:IgGFc-binding protein [Paludibacteraceae bacterium]
MKQFRHIALLLTLAAYWCGSVWGQTVKQLPEVTSTEGREFFVAWLPNGDRTPQSPDLRLQLLASSRKFNNIQVEYPDGTIESYDINPGETTEIIITPQSVYWDASAAEEETPVRKGIRVYSLNDEKFTLYSTSQYGSQDVFSLDGAHILPVEALGTEYMVMNAEGDNTATEFVLMSTKPGVTHVTINLKVNSRLGNTQQLSVDLYDSKQIYIVRSMPHDPDDMTTNIDLSGSTICADQPIAVWSGNQDGLVPYRGGLSTNHAYDQLLPVTKWGQNFIVPMTAQNMQNNMVRFVALEDNTVVTVKRNNVNMPNTPVTLNSGDVFSQTMTQSTGNPNPQTSSLYITADKPIQVYLYSSSAGMNTWYDDFGVDHLPGNPSMTLIPPLEFLTDTTIVSTFNGGAGTFAHEINIWALTSKTNTIRLDGQAMTGWRTVPGNTNYSQNTYPITAGTHTITAPSKCFSGYMYGIDEALAYLYPIGYDYTPHPDSLFLLDNYEQYTIHTSEWNRKAVSNTEGGWHLDKVLQSDDTYLLDSIFVCDSTILNFPIKTYNAWYKVRWEIEGSIQGSGYFDPQEQFADLVSRPQLEHQFTLLPEEINKEPFEDFEVRGILIRKPIFCDIPEDKWERDTFNTIVRVMRQYNDTTWRAICVGDTVEFFRDTVWKVNPRTITGKPVEGQDFVMQISIFNDTTNNTAKGLYQYHLGAQTITRSYLSSGGCDSLSTLKLFVCSPSFEHRDTVICQDGRGRLSYGEFFKNYNNSARWPLGDTVLLDTIRAKDCMRSPEWQEFAPHCPTFNGCDSVLELHLVVKEVVNNTYRKNLCMSQMAALNNRFEWRENVSDRLIKTFWADTMKLDSIYQIPTERVKYKDCEDCPRGGCDSVRNTLWLQFVSDAGQEHTVHVCQGEKYQYHNQTNASARIDFDSNGKLCNTPYIETITVEVRGYDENNNYVTMCSFEDKVTFIVDTVYKDQMSYDTICWTPGVDGQTYQWETAATHPDYQAIPVTREGKFTYTDVRKTKTTNCDSICVLELTVGKPYEMPTRAEICDNKSFTWQDTLFYGINYTGDKPAKSKQVSGPVYKSRKDTVSRYGCDSTLTLTLTIWDTYVAERKDTAICANESYNFFGTVYNTTTNPWKADTIYELKKNVPSIHGCDSAVLHYVTVYPIYLDEWEEPDTICQVLDGTAYYVWEGADHAEWNNRHLQKINNAGSYDLVDHLTTKHGCDSIIHRKLVVLPSYNPTFSRTMSSEDTIHWEGRIYAGSMAVFDNPDQLPVIVYTGQGPIVDSLTTTPVGTHYCDSVRTLDLKVGQVFRDTTYDATCANCGSYKWVLTSPITGANTIIEITDLPAAHETRTYYDSLKTALNYDSIYVLRLTGYESHEFQSGDEVCQGDEYLWTDHMPTPTGVEHRLFYNGRPITEIPTGQHGIIQITDSMLTNAVDFVNPKTGAVKPIRCDSVWTLSLTIHPTYNNRYVDLTDPVSMASNDTVSHFTQPRTLFVGYDFDFDAAGTSPAELAQNYERVVYIDRSEGTSHYDSVVNRSQYGCDSVHYVQINICEVKFTIKRDSIGDNYPAEAWSFGGNTAGRRHTQELLTAELFHSYDNGAPVDYSVKSGRTVREYFFIDTLQTANGCDSIVHDSVWVFPTYEFHFDTAVCSNTRYDWRVLTKLNEQRTGVYYDSVNYQVGTHVFDSVYVLNLDVMPSGYWQYDTILCMNDTIWWHYKKVYYRPGGLTYVEADYKDGSSPCGEKHHLDLTFMPYYGPSLVEYDTICQDDPYRWISPGETKEHTEAVCDGHGRTITSIPTNVPGEYIYYDSLKTKSCGCDSVYTLHLVIRPAYHFYTDTAICTGDEFEWIVKDKDGNDYTNGKTYVSDVTTHFYDTIAGYTPEGCDSTYYLHVFVDQPYDIHIDTTVCYENGHFEWRGDHGVVNYDDLVADSHNWSEPQSFFDTLRTKTTLGQCDSIRYLHLTIAPSADSAWVDTICVGETYRLFENEYTEAGEYHVTHPNAWGCEVNYHLTLRAIPPTRVTLAPEPVCINEAGQDFTYTIRYTYSGEFQPLSYTIRYDSIAQKAGFEDQEEIDMQDRLVAGTEYELYIPTPRIDVKEKYPRPDHYHATIAFENGVCLSDSLMTFPMEITMSYPNWLLEQRHGDVIAILNDTYNGGYTWTEYQWYEGDSMLIGQTRPYLHIPTGLTPGAYYHVELTRTDETEAFPTCEIQAVANPINNDFAPTMGYLSVTPTCVVTGHPVIYILSRKDGTYRVTTADGHLVSDGVFRADVTELSLPAVTGMYIVQLWSNDTPEEPYRAIKVLVREQCPNCDPSSF